VIIAAPRSGFTAVNGSKLPLTLLNGAHQGEELVSSSNSISQHTSPDGRRKRERIHGVSRVCVLMDIYKTSYREDGSLPNEFGIMVLTM
jgi:hypothetical protein